MRAHRDARIWSDFYFFTQNKSTGSPVQQLLLEVGRSFCFQIETMHLRAPVLLVRKLSVALRTVQSGAQVLMAFMEPKKWHHVIIFDLHDC